MRTAVITAVHGRSAHLCRQLQGLARSKIQPDVHVVVAISDDTVAPTVALHSVTAGVVAVAGPVDRLPIAAARNLGARTALSHRADLLIFLDVDCIPGPEMIGAYHVAAEDVRHRGALLCGPVTYLPPPGPDGYNLPTLDMQVDPHPARPAPADDEIVFSTDYESFWSLSFAVTASTWAQIGGFCTRYVGYGAEDTDLAQVAASKNIGLRWVGGAHAFHQFHPVSDPPVEHLRAIVANASVFHERWGWWPMKGWLDKFAAQGLLHWCDGAPTITNIDAATTDFQN